MTTSATPLGLPRDGGTTVSPAAMVEIVIPVTTQQRDLALSILRLHAFLTGGFPHSAHVTIAVSGGCDGTWATALALADSFSEVSAVRLASPGRGGALRSAWLASDCEVLCYLDTDLAIELSALVPLVQPLLSGQADLAIGTRLAASGRPQRAPHREVNSCGSSLLLQARLGVGFADAQCGFKAITRSGARELLPRTNDGGWFFGIELLLLAERAGLRICEVPVNPAGPPGRRPGLRAGLGRRLTAGRPAIGRFFRGTAA